MKVRSIRDMQNLIRENPSVLAKDIEIHPDVGISKEQALLETVKFLMKYGNSIPIGCKL